MSQQNIDNKQQDNQEEVDDYANDQHQIQQDNQQEQQDGQVDANHEGDNAENDAAVDNAMMAQQQQQNEEGEDPANNDEEEGQQQQQPYQPEFSDYIMSLNQNRLAFQQHADYLNAEYSLGQIQNIRQQAEVGLKNSLTDKHQREDVEVEEQNRLEFEKFTKHWDIQVAQLQEQSLVQMQALRTQHEVQMNELKVYLEQTMTTVYKPSPELLNLRKIQYHLSKQKNYTEAERVQATVRQLEIKEQKKFLKQRQQKIVVQLNHLVHKHNLEIEALQKKLDTALKEQDKIRKKEQREILQKFLNIQNQLHINQQLESAKLMNTLKIKNYASTIVGKTQGSMRSCQYAL